MQLLLARMLQFVLQWYARAGILIAKAGFPLSVELCVYACLECTIGRVVPLENRRPFTGLVSSNLTRADKKWAFRAPLAPIGAARPTDQSASVAAPASGLSGLKRHRAMAGWVAKRVRAIADTASQLGAKKGPCRPLFGSSTLNRVL